MAEIRNFCICVALNLIILNGCITEHVEINEECVFESSAAHGQRLLKNTTRLKSNMAHFDASSLDNDSSVFSKSENCSTSDNATLFLEQKPLRLRPKQNFLDWQHIDKANHRRITPQRSYRNDPVYRVSELAKPNTEYATEFRSRRYRVRVVRRHLSRNDLNRLADINQDKSINVRVRVSKHNVDSGRRIEYQRRSENLDFAIRRTRNIKLYSNTDGSRAYGSRAESRVRYNRQAENNVRYFSGTKSRARYENARFHQDSKTSYRRINDDHRINVIRKRLPVKNMSRHTDLEPRENSCFKGQPLISRSQMIRKYQQNKLNAPTCAKSRTCQKVELSQKYDAERRREDTTVENRSAQRFDKTQRRITLINNAQSWEKTIRWNRKSRQDSLIDLYACDVAMVTKAISLGIVGVLGKVMWTKQA